MLKTLKFTLTLVAALCIFSNVFSQKEKERIANYVQQYKQLAIAEMMRTGVPASITLAQGLLETGYGQSDLAQNANNHFGIKCKSDWKGESVLHDDDKKGECFRKYASAEDSYRDHSDFLKYRPNYAFLFTIDPTNYQGWAYGLKKAGYATSPTYAQRLIKFIEENSLQDYTLMALNGAPGKEDKSMAKESIEDAAVKQPINNSNAASSIAITDSNNEPAITSALKNETGFEKRSDYPKDKLFTINSSKVLFVEAGTSLFAVASNYSVSYNKLLEFNELAKIDILERDQLIYLVKKQRKGNKDVHVVETNENLYDIAQKEGVQLNSVLEYNHLTKDSKPIIGQKLYLKSVAPASPKIASSFSGSESSSSMR